MTLPERFKMEILVGATDGEIITVEVRIGDDTNTPENQYISFVHDRYDRNFITEEEGEEKAREYLEDGESWKDAVASGNTEQSKEDYNQFILDSDGWEEVVGDMHQVGDLWTRDAGTGSVKVEDYVKLAITKKDLLFIETQDLELQLHTKKLREIDKKKLAMIRAIFEKYPPFDFDQMAPYSIQAQDEADRKGEEQPEEPEEPETRENPEPEQPHGSPVPPIKIPQDWWDEDGRIIQAEHEEEFMDLVIDKFWRRDILTDEVVETMGAFMGEHTKEQGYEWAEWHGEYRLGIEQYGPARLATPLGTMRQSLRINAIDIASRIIAIEMVDGKMVPIDRLFLRQSHEAITKGGQYFTSKADEMPLAIAIDKTHFMLRKLLIHGAKIYPILEWVEMSTMTTQGVDAEMKLVAVHPDGGRVTRLAPIDIPTSKFYYDDMIEKGYGLFINLEGYASVQGSTPIEYATKMYKELDRIFTPGIEVEVEELPITKTSMDEVQKGIDDIEREIRVLRAKEHDFDSPNSAVARRLGKQKQYDTLLKQRDELMWRENPSARVKRAA